MKRHLIAALMFGLALMTAVGGLAMFAGRAEAQSRLPPCPSDQSVRWHNCFGTYTWADSGEPFVGGWKDNQWNGQETFTFAYGSKYVGEFKDDKRNGHGTFTFADGSKYVGEFNDNKYKGNGKEFAANGSVAREGYWIDGNYFGRNPPPGYQPPNAGSPIAVVTPPPGYKPPNAGTAGRAEAQSRLPPCPSDQSVRWHNCFGTLTYANGDKYVGEYKDDKHNGKGTYTYANGNKYVGESKDSKYNGQGTFTFADGRKYVGEWKDDKYNGNGKEFAANGRLTREGYWIVGNYFGPTPPPGNKPPNAGSRIAMVKDGGTYTVPVTINGVLPLQFTVDSGASDVSVPADVVMVLIRTGSLKDSDFTGSQKYKLADGSTVNSKTFNIRSLKVGDRTVTNVKGSVADVNGGLLLGQSFLGKFKSWSMDNTKHELVLE